MKLRAFLSRPDAEDLSVAEAAVPDWEIAARRVRAKDLLQVAKDLGAAMPMFCAFTWMGLRPDWMAEREGLQNLYT